MHSNSII